MLSVAFAVFGACYVFSVDRWPPPQPWELVVVHGAMQLMAASTSIALGSNLKGLPVSSHQNGYPWSVGYLSVGSGLPTCPDSAWSLQENGCLTFLPPTPQFRIIKS